MNKPDNSEITDLDELTITVTALLIAIKLERAVSPDTDVENLKISRFIMTVNATLAAADVYQNMDVSESNFRHTFTEVAEDVFEYLNNVASRVRVMEIGGQEHAEFKSGLH